MRTGARRGRTLLLRGVILAGLGCALLPGRAAAWTIEGPSISVGIGFSLFGVEFSLVSVSVTASEVWDAMFGGPSDSGGGSAGRYVGAATGGGASTGGGAVGGGASAHYAAEATGHMAAGALQLRLGLLPDELTFAAPSGATVQIEPDGRMRLRDSTTTLVLRYDATIEVRGPDGRPVAEVRRQGGVVQAVYGADDATESTARRALAEVFGAQALSPAREVRRVATR